MKRWICSLLALILCLSLCACGGAAEPTKAPTEAPTEAPTAEPTLSSEEPEKQAEEAAAAYHETMSAGGTGVITDNKAVAYLAEKESWSSDTVYPGTYTTQYVPENMLAETPDEVRYIVYCIYYNQVAGNYQYGGARAYRRIMDVQIVERIDTYPYEKVLGENSFEGGDPPEVVTDMNDHYGDFPDAAEVTPWVEQVIQEARAARKDEALAQAQRMLERQDMGYSYSGLIDLLTDEYGGFSVEEATYAADNCGADWNEQAVIYAKWDISVYGWTKKEDVIFNLTLAGFTQEQAAYGAEQALKE